MNIDALLAPVSTAAPCGEDLAFSPELDAMARARQADDPSIEQGAWVTTLKEADWKFVAAACTRLLATRSKDLRLAVWLAEASAKTSGFRALGDAIHVVTGLCERYWDALYPLPDEDSHEQRIGNLCWLAGRVGQLARELPVTDGAAGYSLNQFAAARAQAGRERDGHGAPALEVADLEAARQRAPGGFYRQLREDAGYCEQALLQLEQVIDARLGADGPGFAGARAALQDVAHFAGPLEGSVTAHKPAQAPAAQPVLVASPLASEPRSLQGTQHGLLQGPLQTRSQALAQLRAVAVFFRQTEPHSPVAYLADKAAHWGEQPLHVWLRAVIKDDVQYAQLEEMLGAQAKG